MRAGRTRCSRKTLPHYVDIGHASGTTKTMTSITRTVVLRCYCTLFDGRRLRGPRRPRSNAPSPRTRNADNDGHDRAAPRQEHLQHRLRGHRRRRQARPLQRRDHPLVGRGELRCLALPQEHRRRQGRLHPAATRWAWAGSTRRSTGTAERDLAVAAESRRQRRQERHHRRRDRLPRSIRPPFPPEARRHLREIGEAVGFTTRARAGSIADFDRDGDLGIVVGSGTARDCSAIWATNEVHLYENDANQNGHFGGGLTGGRMTANRSGYGARVISSSGKRTEGARRRLRPMAMQNDTVLLLRARELRVRRQHRGHLANAMPPSSGGT